MAEQPIEVSLASLKHVVRRQLLRCLGDSEEPRTPSSLGEQMGTSTCVASYHLRALEGAGLARLASREPESGSAGHRYAAAVGDDAAVRKVLDETAEADERLLPRAR
jgi:DNA-binding transcriptional ArsR family regulator